MEMRFIQYLRKATGYSVSIPIQQVVLSKRKIHNVRELDLSAKVRKFVHKNQKLNTFLVAEE